MKILKNILIFITILFLIWFTISYLQITSQNLNFDEPTILSNWNFFKLLIQCFFLSRKSPKIFWDSFFKLDVIRLNCAPAPKTLKIFLKNKKFFKKVLDFFLEYVIL